MRTAKPEDWHTESLPAKRTTIALSRTLSAHEIEPIRRGLVPEQMEDKWFIYWKDNALFFHRSWTGYCHYIVRFAAKGGNWEMVEADVNRDSEQYLETDDERDAAMISYLVDVLLLHRDAVLPSSEPSSEKSVMMSWTQVGRAMFGQHPGGDGETAQQGAPMAKKGKIWKPLTPEHFEELITLVVQAYQLNDRTPSMRRLAAELIKLAAWRWTADAVDSVTGMVIPDAIKYDVRYLPHTPNAAAVLVQHPNELSKRLRHEHTVPLRLLAKLIFGLETDSRESIREIFQTYCCAAIVTREEDRLLNKAKLRSAMPLNWSFGQGLLARYSYVGIELLPLLSNTEMSFHASHRLTNQ